MVNYTTRFDRFIPGLAPHNLFFISEAMLEKLPRELRDLTYDYILDLETLNRLRTCAFEGHSRSGVARDTWPDFIHRNAIVEPIRVELVARFCRDSSLELPVWSYSSLSSLAYSKYASSPRDSSAMEWSYRRLFGVDLFGTGSRLTNSMISSLVVSFKFYNHENPDVGRFYKDLETLLHECRLPTENFRLTLRLHTHCLSLTSVLPFHQLPSSFVRDIGKMITQVQEVYACLGDIKDMVETTGTRRLVVMGIRFEQHDRPDLDLEVQEEMLQWDAKAWWDYVEPQVKLMN